MMRELMSRIIVMLGCGPCMKAVEEPPELSTGYPLKTPTDGKEIKIASHIDIDLCRPIGYGSNLCSSSLGEHICIGSGC